MTCEEFFWAATDPAGPLSPAEDAELDAHDRECRKCNGLRELIASIRDLLCKPRGTPPPWMEERVVEFAKAATERRRLAWSQRLVGSTRRWT